MGFFTDAYDLFVIGVVVSILKTKWHLSTDEVSLLSSATLGPRRSVRSSSAYRRHPGAQADLRL